MGIQQISKEFVEYPYLTNWWNSKNGDTITINKNEIIYGITDNFAWLKPLHDYSQTLINYKLPQGRKKSFTSMPS